MIARMFILVVAGILYGYFTSLDFLRTYIDSIITIFVGVLLFTIGLSVGNQREMLQKLDRKSIRMLLLPIFVGIGSVLGCVIAGLFLSLPVNQTSAIGAGFGWFTLSGAMLTQLCNAKVGAIAFFTNFIRDVIALTMMPLIAARLGNYAAIASCGNTSSDILLPAIQKYLGNETVIIAVIHGILLNAAVPLLISLLITIPF